MIKKGRRYHNVDIKTKFIRNTRSDLWNSGKYCNKNTLLQKFNFIDLIFISQLYFY